MGAHRTTHLCASIVVLGQLFLPVAAGVLPDDRADVLYHYYDGGGVQIDGPSILVRKKVKQDFSLYGNYYVDSVSSASIDVITSGDIGCPRLALMAWLQSAQSEQDPTVAAHPWTRSALLIG